jgi:hypothetical protein
MILFLAVIILTLAIAMVIFHKPKKWLLLHKILAIIGVTLSLIGVITLGGLVLAIIHGILGIIVLIILIGDLFGGWIAIKLKDRRMRLVHIWASRIVYVVTLVVLVLGVLNFI